MAKKTIKVSKKRTKKHLLVKNLSIVGLLVIIGLSAMSILTYFTSDEKAHSSEIVELKNQNTVYLVSSETPDGNSNGYYYLYPVEIRNQIGKAVVNKEQPVYIAKSPESLEPYLNKKVKVTGKVVWSDSLVTRPGFDDNKSDEKNPGVVIDSIESVH